MELYVFFLLFGGMDSIACHESHDPIEYFGTNLAKVLYLKVNS